MADVSASCYLNGARLQPGIIFQDEPLRQFAYMCRTEPATEMRVQLTNRIYEVGGADEDQILYRRIRTTLVIQWRPETH